MTFGQRVTLARREKKLTQAQLGAAIGTTGDMVGKYERDAIKPSIEVAAKIADALDSMLDYLIRDVQSVDKSENLSKTLSNSASPSITLRRPRALVASAWITSIVLEIGMWQHTLGGSIQQRGDQSFKTLPGKLYSKGRLAVRLTSWLGNAFIPMTLNIHIMKGIFSIACLITFSGTLFAQEKQADDGLVRTTLNNYIEGRNNGDTARLASAFHKQADFRFRDEKTGNLVIWRLSEYVTKFTPGRKMNCTGKIVSIDIAGSTAQAKIELYYPDKTYADYINLLRIGNKWLIASKGYSRYPDSK